MMFITMLVKKINLIMLLYLMSQNSVLGLYEGDYCTNDNGEKGVCTQSNSCKNIQKLLKSGMRPTICGFSRTGPYPIVCCPPDKNEKEPQKVSTSDQNNPYMLAKEKCDEYGETVKEIISDPVLVLSAGTIKKDNCGRIAETLVLGGVEAKPREFPHMALIGYRDEIEWLCGGSLISNRFVLSAAHCSVPKRKGRAKWVKLGELDTSTDFEEAEPVIYRILDIIDHPEYNAATLYNDIALYKLEEEVEFTPFIRPICLPIDPEIMPGHVTASGWGHTEWGGSSSSHLMKVNLDVVSNKACNEKFAETISRGKQIPQGIRSNSMICAGNEIGKDTCQGDSGGPLQVNLTEPYCMYSIIGVTSFGRGCGLGYPGVYTQVYHYVPWIVEIIWQNEQ